MILRNATIKYKGYDPNDLKPKSHKRICCSCNMCGRVRWIMKQDYRDLCITCWRLGSNNPFYGKKHSDETKKLQSIIKSGKNNPMYGKCEELNPAWQGGYDRKRPWVLPETRCIKLNSHFKDSEFHHITRSIGVYIPKDLHRHIWHSLKDGQNMGSMNMLALQYLVGEL